MQDTVSNTKQYPNHVAIIMDGNGRWAEKRSLPRLKGHQEGAKATKRIVEEAQKQGIGYLTLFAFSIENWKRPSGEVNGLMNLLRRYLKSDVTKLHEQGARIIVIGNRDDLADDIIEQINHVEDLTKNNQGIVLQIALSYGGRQEIINATKEIAEKVKLGHLKQDEINEAVLEDHLMTKGIPPLDLLIRTSGEKRVSNFLLWQLAYTELYFSNRCWPDFTPQDFVEALEQFSMRQRRFGALPKSTGMNQKKIV